MKKVALATCYSQRNYGSMLQAYATQRYLDKLNIPNETLCTKGFEKEIRKAKLKYFKSCIFKFDIIKDKWGFINLAFYKKIKKKTLGANIKVRNNKFDRFSRDHFHMSQTFNSIADLKKGVLNYSAVLVGSDQLWLPSNISADYYTLNFVPDNILKISYATSFGVQDLPSKQADAAKRFLPRFDYLSVRELSGKKIIKDLIKKDISIVCDPTLLLDEEEWNIIQKSERFIPEPYILCYFLGNNLFAREFSSNLKKKTGLKIVALKHLDAYIKEDNDFADEAPYNVDPGDFINLIRYAEYVCTDSFHGTIFSIIYKKKFFTFRRFVKKTSMSTNNRLDSLLSILSLESRLINYGTSVDEKMHEVINYLEVNKKLSIFQHHSQKYLKQCFANIDSTYIKTMRKKECCGCSACASICPRNSISMESDEEGFLYPKKNENTCINCDICEMVCAIKNSFESRSKQNAFLIQHKNIKVLKESTSGGAFSAIAEDCIEQGGVVFGALFDDDLCVKHDYVENKSDLYKFRNSKYVQSDMGSCFNKIKTFLEQGRQVCFSGTPCQIEGLSSFLMKRYDNLLLIDVVCHAIPSPLVWKRYLEYRNNNKHAIKYATFRNKELYGYNYSQMAIKESNKTKYYGIESDPYLRAFFSDISDRPSCYACRFKKRYRVSDITLWDCFDAQKFNKGLDNNKGVTRALTHTKKGERIIKSIKKSCIVFKIPVKEAVNDTREMTRSVSYNPRRTEFFLDIHRLPVNMYFKKYFPITTRTKLERVIRSISARLGIYTAVKSIAKKVLRHNNGGDK